MNRERAEQAVRDLLGALGEDSGRAGLLRTPGRVVDALLDAFSGVGQEPSAALGSPTEIEDGEHGQPLVALTAIPFRSTCEHHLLPFSGIIDVVYAPDAKIAGLSRIVAAIEVAARRPQLQERLGTLIADAMTTVLDPIGVAVRIDATHGCLARLEPQASTARCITLTTRGRLPPDALTLLA